MWRYALKPNKVAVISVSNPPVNALSLGVRTGLLDGIAKARADKAAAVVIVGDGRTFPAGADIAEFASGAFRTAPSLMDVVKAMGDVELPLVAAIHGTALGGGLETAMACHYRVALPSAKLGLPEVHLGIMPGASGTQRLPRLVGVESALNMIGTGKPVSAAQAQSMGLVDAVVEGGTTADDLLAGAVDFAGSLAGSLAGGAALPTASEHAEVPADAEQVYAAAEKLFAKVARGQVAPRSIVAAVKASTRMPLAEGLEVEELLFDALERGPQAAAMQHLFFAERQCHKVDGIDAKAARDVGSVGVIGGGTMGRGIAMCFLNKNIAVVLCETSAEAAAAAEAAIRALYERSSAFRKGALSQDALDQRMALFSTSTDASFEALKDVDAVVEAAFESMELKREIFGKLGKVCKPEALLGTNTSYLDIDVIAEASGRPESVVGTHFFSPANVMTLLENVRGSKSSDATIATAMAMGKKIGKTTVLAGNAFGFIGNRMFEPYTQQAICLLEEGALPSQVDRVLVSFGMAMGPLAVFDLAGNDIGYRIRKEPYYPHTPQAVQGSRGASWMALADALCELGRHGQKTKAGWYSYEATGRAAEDDVVHALLDEHRAKFGIAKREHISDEEVLQRCLYPLINEGARILEDGIAQRSADIDVVWNAGYGFGRHKGGPMHHADAVGLRSVVDALLKHKENQPDLPAWHFEPAKLLVDLANSGGSLKDFKAEKAT